MRRPLPLILIAACAGPAASGPENIQPQAMPDGPPANSAMAAMAPTLPAQAWAPTPAPAPLSSEQLRRAHVEALLGEGRPPPPASELRQPGVYQALHDIFHDPRESPGLRARALAAMGDLHDARGIAELHMVLDRTDAAPLFLRTAIFTLARAQGAAAIPRLVPELASPDVTVRIATAEALGGIGGPKARAVLSRRLVVEPDGEVKATIRASLDHASP